MFDDLENLFVGICDLLCLVDEMSFVDFEVNYKFNLDIIKVVFIGVFVFGVIVIIQYLWVVENQVSDLCFC